MLNATHVGHGTVLFDFVKDSAAPSIAAVPEATSTNATGHPISTGPAPSTVTTHKTAPKSADVQQTD